MKLEKYFTNFMIAFEREEVSETINGTDQGEEGGPIEPRNPSRNGPQPQLLESLSLTHAYLFACSRRPVEMSMTPQCYKHGVGGFI